MPHTETIRQSTNLSSTKFKSFSIDNLLPSLSYTISIWYGKRIAKRSISLLWDPPGRRGWSMKFGIMKYPFNRKYHSTNSSDFPLGIMYPFILAVNNLKVCHSIRDCPTLTPWLGLLHLWDPYKKSPAACSKLHLGRQPDRVCSHLAPIPVWHQIPVLTEAVL